jgi:hypothetical protein
MRNLFIWPLAAIIATLPCIAGAAEKVGETVRVSVQVNGDQGVLSKGDDIHRNEHISSNISGSGAFVFEDGTKLAVGPNSLVVIDEFVYSGGATVEKLVLGATKGTFRWISGKSDSSAYQIRTPSGALGVRGTAFDVYVGPDGTTAVTLLNGSAEFCTSQGCQRLNRRCEFLLARPNGDITKPKGVVRDIGLNKRAEDVFPFLTGKAGLPRGFSGNASCAGLESDAASGSRFTPSTPKPRQPEKNFQQ